MVVSQVSGEFLGWLPSEGPWLHAGRNSRESRSRVKACVYSRRYTLHRQKFALSQKVRVDLKYGLAVPSHFSMSNTVRDPVNCSSPGSSVCGILQAKILEWIAIPFSRASSRPQGKNWRVLLLTCSDRWVLYY